MTDSTNPDELAKYIQYRLGMLGEENAHHRFEELCFRVARATVASHLLPPTGPVSAGGDQGRDFESFRIEGAGGNITRFFAQSVATTDTIVFACTTQKGSDADLSRKVKSDVATACARDPKPTIIYFYLASVTLSPAARHNLQDWARREHNIALEIIDQRSIAELLADPANGWLAQHYLSVPEGMLPHEPTGPVQPEWYEEAKRRFSNPDERYIATHAELDLVVRCARHAWEADGLEADDGLWLDLLADLWGAPDGLTREHGLRAFYEAFVYLLRGRERCGLESHIPTYVAGLVSVDDLGLARDAQCFASYLVGGVARGHIALDHSVAQDLFQSLVDWIEAKINTPPGPLVLSDLLVARGSVVFAPTSLRDEPPSEEELASLATETLHWWTRALDAGEKLVSFPLLRLGELLGNIAPVLTTSPDYDAFVERLDQACEQRHTSEGLAAKLRDRAMVFFKAERYLDALSPMLGAKRHWHNGDRLRGSLLASMLAEQCMERLGLVWAAKRLVYDVVAVCIRTGDQQHTGLLADAVFHLAELEYLAGEWATALYTYRLALRLHLEYAVDPWNFEKHARLRHGTFYLVNMLVAGDLAAPGFRAWGEKVVEIWDLGEELEHFSEKVQETWENQGVVRGVVGRECPLHGPPLTDLSATRRARWQALGLTWEVTWLRDYELEATGTELAALLQFIQAGLAKRYMHLLPTSVAVEVVPWREGEAPVQPVPYQHGIGFRVMLPASESRDDPTQDLRTMALFAASMIIEAASVDPNVQDQFPDLVGNMIRDGVYVGGGVLEGRSCLLSLETWREIMSAPTPTGHGVRLEVVPDTQLPWRRGRSPLFDEASADEKLQNRYDGGFRSARPILEAHGSNPELHHLVTELRADGWLDWQIASAFALAVASDYANDLHRHGASQQAVHQAMQDGMQKAMAGEYNAPPWSESFSQSIRMCLQGSLVSALEVWGLGVNYPTPDMDALRRFLGERFQHFTHDLPADQRPKFPWEEASQQPVPSPNALDWIDELYDFVAHERTDDAVDLLFKHVDELLSAERFDQCDEILRVVDLNRLDTHLIVALLSITLSASGQLPYRTPLLEHARDRLSVLAPDRVDRLLSGLS